MYDVEAMFTETSPTVLKLTADWPVDWLRETGTWIMEIQRELLPGEILELPSVPTERAEIDGNRANWLKLRVGNRIGQVLFPGRTNQILRSPKSIQYSAVLRPVVGAGGNTQ